MSRPPVTTGDLRRDFVKTLLLPALTLLVLPLLGWGFAVFAARDYDRRAWEYVERHIDASTEIPAEQKPEARAFYRANAPSVLCSSDDPQLSQLREDACPPGEDVWQFVLAARVSRWALLLGVAALLGALGLGFVAWRVPRLQYATFVAGWTSLTLISAVEIVAQGVLATWLSYWVTALVMHVYVVKLILVVALMAAVGVFTALVGIFKRVRFTPQVEGELISRADGSKLWARLDQLAARVGTAAPANLIGGIDDNFFVTESPLAAGQTQLRGRSLFVSLPMLRVLSSSEADAVLAHELAHFRGGDTAASARLRPALIRYDLYLAHLAEQLATRPAFHLMGMFRAVFELASKKANRERELVADRVAAQTTSGEDLSRALLKVTAYSSHRAATEHTMFQQDQTHAQLALKTRIAEGLGAHVATDAFRDALAAVNTPHPFDSHPPLGERLAALGSTLNAKDCEALVAAPPPQTWTEQLPTATEIEDRLWAAYEARFVDAHELSLAHRYLPTGDAEQAVVERCFPEKTFAHRTGLVRVTWATVDVPNFPRLAWADVFSMTLDEGNFKNELWLNHRSGSAAGLGPTTIDLKGLPDDATREALKQTLVQYWQRDQSARQWVAQQASPAT